MTRKATKMPKTPRQREVLLFVRNYILAWGCAPTLREIGFALRMSCATAHGHVKNLVGLGCLLKRKKYAGRTLALAKGVVLDPPKCGKCGTVMTI